MTTSLLVFGSLANNAQSGLAGILCRLTGLVGFAQMLLERRIEYLAGKSVGEGMAADRAAFDIAIQYPVWRQRFFLWLHAPSLRRRAIPARAVNFKRHHYPTFMGHGSRR